MSEDPGRPARPWQAPGSPHDQIRELFHNELRAEAPRWERERRLPRSVFTRLASTGAFAARWPLGGDGDFSVAATLAREAALTSVGAAIGLSLHTDGFLPLIQRSEWGQEMRGRVLDGSLIGCVAVSEPASGSDVTRCETRAERSGSGWVIDGRKQYVSNFETATDCVVFARTGEGGLGGFTLFAVPTDAPGITATPHATIGARAAGTCAVDFEQVEVPTERRLGPVGSGLPSVLGFLRRERLWVTIGSTALAELCFEAAHAFACSRQVGGEPLIRRQAIAHRLADMRTTLAATESIAAELTTEMIDGGVSAGRAAEGKLFAAGSACRLADEAIQILGGRGYTEETPIAALFNDVRVLRIGGGTDEILRELIDRTEGPGALAEHPAVAAAAAASLPVGGAAR
ncbi:MAG TPA: acyl-CoA dehydrogenase family protein [Solirubrobacterales bacterium]|nr:acyl-CoA dehydrogenase family protein [Solirubrobacterales bacterium]